MEKILYIIIYIAAVTLTAACSDSWDDQYSDTAFEGVIAPSFSVSSDSLVFSDQASSQEITVAAHGRWTAKSNVSWLTVSCDQGGGGTTAVTVTVQANTNTLQARKGTITIGNGINNKTVNVLQSAMAENLYVTVASLTSSFSGESGTVDVQANVTWTVSSNANWLTVKKNDGGTAFTWTANPNISTQPRQAVITVKGVSLQHAIAVAQTAVRAPTIAALTVSGITKHSADCSLQATSSDIDITEYGIYYSASAQSPGQGNAQTLKADGGGRSVRQVFQLKDLKSKTTYYVRPYVVTSLGRQYGDTTTFTTPVSAPNEDDNGTPND